MVKVIFIEGLIGSGKSTLCHYINEEFNKNNIKSLFVKEPVEKWKDIGILQEFYADMKNNSYKFQSYAFITRYMSIINIDNPNQYDIILIERSIFSDKYMFAYNLYESKLMSETEYNMYNEWWNLWSISLKDSIMFKNNNLKEINFTFLYWRPSFNITIERIKERSRPGEIVPEEYQKSLQVMHDNFFIDKTNTIIDDKLHNKDYNNINNNINYYNSNTKIIINNKDYNIKTLIIECDEDYRNNNILLNQIKNIIIKF